MKRWCNNVNWSLESVLLISNNVGDIQIEIGRSPFLYWIFWNGEGPFSNTELFRGRNSQYIYFSYVEKYILLIVVSASQKKNIINSTQIRPWIYWHFREANTTTLSLQRCPQIKSRTPTINSKIAKYIK